MGAVEVQGPLKFLLVGKVGAGKSSAGNSILLSNDVKFKTGATTGSVTQAAQEEYGRVMGREVKVVDVPGLADSEQNDEGAIQNLVEQIKSALKLNPDGFDVILLVIPFGRLSRLDVTVVDQLKGIFGEKFIAEYGVLLITRSGDFDPEETGVCTIEKWCSEQTGLLEKLRQECCGRVVFFENKYAENEEKSYQVEQLFHTVEKMKYGPKRYTPDLFHAAQKERDLLLLKAMKLRLVEEIHLKNKAVKETLDSIKLENPEKDISELKNILGSVQELLREMREQDKGYGELNEMVDTLLGLEKLIQDKLCRARNVYEYIIKERDSKRNISVLREDHAAKMMKFQKDNAEKEHQIYVKKKNQEAALASCKAKLRSIEAENKCLKVRMILTFGASVLKIGAVVLGVLTIIPAVAPVALIAVPILGVVSSAIFTGIMVSNIID